MGLAWIGKLLSFTRVERNGAKLSDVKLDIGGGEVLTGEHAHPSGEDAHPLPGDCPVAVEVAQTGRVVVVAYVETDATEKAGPGDKRIYARGEDRLETVELWLKADGSATLANANGFFTLFADGSQRHENPNGSSTLAVDGSTTLVNPNGQFELKADGTVAGTNGSGDFELQAGGTMDINGATIDPSGNIIATSFSAPSIVAAGKELAAHAHAITGGSSAPGPTGPNL